MRQPARPFIATQSPAEPHGGPSKQDDPPKVTARQDGDEGSNGTPPPADDLGLILDPVADQRTPLHAQRPRRRGHRYSQIVSWAKIGFPAAAVVLAALVVIWPQLERVGEDAFSIGIAAISRQSLNLEQVVNARFYGTDDDRQPFSVTADLAEEIEPGSRIVRLEHPQADITLSDGAWVMMSAQEGHYHQLTSQLDLKGEVSLFHDGGYELHTEQAAFDMPAGKAEGSAPVHAQGPFGTLNSQGFQIDRQAETITFTGKARLILRDGADLSLSTPSAQPQEDR